MDYASDRKEGNLNKSKSKSEEDEYVSFREVKGCNRLYYMILGVSIFSDAAIWTYYGIQIQFLAQRFGLSTTKAAHIAGYHFLGQIFLCPLFGFMCDKWGNRALLLLISNFLQIISFLLMIFYPFDSSFLTPDCITETSCLSIVYVSYILLSVSNSMLVIYWSCVPLIVP